nr:transcriptional activator protein acu-15 [Quercus suber]
MLGLPKHLKDEDIQCEYPVDADDEYVTERGFQPSLPGESTKLSSALALFRLARTLSKVLEEVFPAKASYDLSLSTMSDLADELDAWNNALAPHLRLHFAQDKPSTGTISSRSPLLSLAYHYTRALIHRPAVCASIGNKSSSSMIALANSSKHLIQITQLLEERGMCFASCINKDELLVLSTFGLGFQSMKLDPTSKILRDNQKMVRNAVELLHKSDAPCANELDSVITTFMSPGDALEPSPRQEMVPSPVAQPSKQDCNTAEAANGPSLSAPPASGKQLKAIASRFTSNHKAVALVPRTTVHDTNLRLHDQTNTSSRSLPPAGLIEGRKARRSESGLRPDHLHHRSVSTAGSSSGLSLQKPYPTPSPGPKHKVLNLDYLSFGGEQENSDVEGRDVPPIKPEPQPTDWEKLLGSLDNGTTNIYDACYGGLPIEALVDSPSLPQAPNDKMTAAANEDASSAWTSSDLWTLCQSDTNTTADSAHTARSGQAGSVLSFSSDDFTAGPQGNTTTDGVTYADWLSTLEPSILDATPSPGRASRYGLVSATFNAFSDHDLSL